MGREAVRAIRRIAQVGHPRGIVHSDEGQEDLELLRGDARVGGDRRILRGANGARRVPLGKEGQADDHADAHGETQFGQVMKRSVHHVNLLVESENGGRHTCHTTLSESLRGQLK